MGDNKRNIAVKVNLNEAEYEALAARSQASGYSFGALIRQALNTNQPKGKDQQCQKQV